MVQKEKNHLKYIKNKDSIIKRNRAYDVKNKMIVFEYYSEGEPRCACCNEAMIEFLSVDHINNDGAKHRKNLGA